MNRYKFTFLFFGLLSAALLCQPAYAKDSSWQIKKNQDGIKIYARKVEGSPIQEYKALMTVHAPMRKVLKLFLDVGRVKNWMYKCKEYKEIHKGEPGKNYFYFLQELPWPVADRDITTQRVQTIDPKTKAVTFTINEAPGIYPVQKGIVRITYFKSTWQFIPEKGGNVRIVYQIHLDPSGNIPKWLVNQMGTDSPFYSFKQFRELLKTS